jgi:hypothetical protein
MRILEVLIRRIYSPLSVDRDLEPELGQVNGVGAEHELREGNLERCAQQG